MSRCTPSQSLRALTKQSDEEFRSKHPTFESTGIILDDCDAEGVEVFKAEVASAKLAAAIDFTAAAEPTPPVTMVHHHGALALPDSVRQNRRPLFLRWVFV